MPSEPEAPMGVMQDANWLRRHRWHNAVTWSVFVAALATILIISFLVTPHDIESGRVWLSPTCPSARFFGRECPTCGMTRAFSALSRGRLSDAMGYNRGSPVVYVLAWAGMAWGAVNMARSLREARRFEQRRTTR